MGYYVKQPHCCINYSPTPAPSSIIIKSTTQFVLNGCHQGIRILEHLLGVRLLSSALGTCWSCHLVDILDKIWIKTTTTLVTILQHLLHVLMKLTVHISLPFEHLFFGFVGSGSMVFPFPLACIFSRDAGCLRCLLLCS